MLYSTSVLYMIYEFITKVSCVIKKAVEFKHSNISLISNMATRNFIFSIAQKIWNSTSMSIKSHDILIYLQKITIILYGFILIRICHFYEYIPVYVDICFLSFTLTIENITVQNKTHTETSPSNITKICYPI